MYRQGDVLLMPVSAEMAPKGAEIPRGHALVRGATGHSHVLRGAVRLFESAAPEGHPGWGCRVAEAVESFQFVHETDDGAETGEHGSHAPPPGVYLVVGQSGYQRGSVTNVED